MPVQRCKRYVFNRVSLNLLTRMFYQLLGGGGGGNVLSSLLELRTIRILVLYTGTARIQRNSRKETKRGKEKEKNT